MEVGNIEGPLTQFSGSAFVVSLDPEKCSQLTLSEKRELVHEIAQWPEEAPLVLSLFTRKALLEIICAEMGKERKYTGLAKPRMIDILLKVVMTNKRKQNPNFGNSLLSANTELGTKRQTPNENSGEDNPGAIVVANHMDGQVKLLKCENSDCGATLRPGDGFCRRCSCCICHTYNDNKDPSLWLTCRSISPNGGLSCGLSCHVKCALRHEKTGILKTSSYKLDGQFYCIACGKSNDLMGTWIKQLLIAKEAKRVGALCMRISLCRKLLDGTKIYKDLHKLVDSAAKELKKEVGPLDRVSEKRGKGIVSRLRCGAEVRTLCASALEAYQNSIPIPYRHPEPPNNSITCRISFEHSKPTSVVIALEYEDHLLEDFVGCRIWHQESSIASFPDKPNCIVLRPEKKFKICTLNPSTEYKFRVSLFGCNQVFGTWDATWVTPSAKSHHHPLLKLHSLNVMDKNRFMLGLPLVSAASVPATPSKADGMMWQSENAEFDYCVRVIKGLEAEGYLKMDFRVKFLTWYSLKASKEERRVVSAYVEAMGDDPPSLAGQLMDSFGEEIGEEKQLKLFI